jgi:hypothetical protein
MARDKDPDTAPRHVKAADAPEHHGRPAKKPRGYCTKLKGPHDFQFTERHAYMDNTILFDYYRCIACGKKRVKEVRITEIDHSGDRLPQGE